VEIQNAGAKASSLRVWLILARRRSLLAGKSIPIAPFAQSPQRSWQTGCFTPAETVGSRFLGSVYGFQPPVSLICMSNSLNSVPLAFRAAAFIFLTTAKATTVILADRVVFTLVEFETQKVPKGNAEQGTLL